MPLLIHTAGPDRGKRFFFERTVLLGRGPLADVELRDAAVSRRHAQISLQDGHCFLADLGSGNGSWLNEARVTEPMRLADGDLVRLGSVVLEFRSGDDRAPARRKAGARAEASRSDSLKVAIGEPAVEPGSRSVVMSLEKLRSHGGTRLAEEVARLQRRLDFFREAGGILTRTLDQTQLLDQLLARTMEILPQADRAFVVRYDAGTDGFEPLAARTRDGSTAEIAASRTLLEEVVRKREALMSIDAAADEGFEAARSIHLLNLRAVACVPLLVEDRVCGVLQVDNAQLQRAFGEADLDLLAGIAGPIALALEHARLHRELVDREVLEHDLALARRIQQSFLPARAPELPGWSLAVEYSPAHEVGGDLYDLFPLPDGRLGVAIGDVSGKGVSGALLMARLTSALRAAAAHRPEPSAVVAELDALVAGEVDEGMFVTFAFGVLDPMSGRLELANAGHPSPLVRRADGSVGELSLPAGTPLGLGGGRAAGTQSVTLARNELLLFFTDGLNEAADPAGRRFETGGILAPLQSLRSADPRAALDAVLQAARTFVSTRGFDDDLTVLTLARL